MPNQIMVTALQFFMGSDANHDDSESEGEVSLICSVQRNIVVTVNTLQYYYFIFLEWKRSYQRSWYGSTRKQEVPKARKTNGKSQEDFEGRPPPSPPPQTFFYYWISLIFFWTKPSVYIFVLFCRSGKIQRKHPFSISLPFI